MIVLKAIILGLIQGLTEFLPVSSSGHLVLARHLFGLGEAGVTFDILLHLGTLLAIILVYWRDLLGLLRTVLAMPRGGGDPADRRMVLALVLGILPVVVVALLFEDTIEATFRSPRMAAGMLLLTASLLIASHRFRHATGEVTPRRGFLVGVAQILAILPGVSRSGTTISVAMMVGIRPQEAARFSFLMAVPLFLGAAIVKVPDLLDGATGMPTTALVAGFLTAFASGYVAIRWLLAIIAQGQFVWFGVYCAVVGVIGLLVL
jgi:undecaprenyl-diphosphatase